MNGGPNDYSKMLFEKKNIFLKKNKNLCLHKQKKKIVQKLTKKVYSIIVVVKKTIDRSSVLKMKKIFFWFFNLFSNIFNKKKS